jgi:tetratricopeptide (TPR) repeat protein
MEYIQGVAVSDLIRQRGHLEFDVALDICRQTLIGLQVAFENNIVHRDIKPANLMVTVGNVVKVMDFGIAKNLEAQGLTQTGMLGTPNYISPEQADGRGTDTRSDIYSLGAALFEMLTGRLLFEGDSAITVAIKHISAPVPPVRSLRPDTPPEIEALVNKSLQKDPAARFQMPYEMVDAINGIIGEFSAPILLETGSAYAPGGVARNPATVGGHTGAATAVRTGLIARPGGTTAIPEKRTGSSPMLFASAGVGALVLLLALAAVAYLFLTPPPPPVVESAVLAADLNPDGCPVNTVTTYDPNQTFAISVKLNNADPKTKVGAKWFSGNNPTPVGERSATAGKSGSGCVGLKLAPQAQKPWTLGDYKAEVYVNDALKKTVAFTVNCERDAARCSVDDLLREADRNTFDSKFDDATNLYKQANTLDPKNAVVAARWGRALLYQQKLADAIKKLEEATKLEDKNFEAWGYLALAYDWSGRFGDASDAIDKALELSPFNADLHAFKAEIIVDSSRDREMDAAVLEVQLAESYAQNRATVQRAVGNIAYRNSKNRTDANQLKISEDAQKKAIELEPNLYLHHFELGTFYYNTKRFDQAIQELNAANNLYKQATTYYYLGRALYDTTGCKDAGPVFRIATTMDPSNQSAREWDETCRQQGGK